MVTRCTVCMHPKRAEIECDLKSGVSYQKVADKYGTSKSSISRHVKHGLRKDLDEEIRFLRKMLEALTSDIDDLKYRTKFVEDLRMTLSSVS